MPAIHKINDLIIRIELDLQKAKDAILFDSDLQRAKNRMIAVSEQSRMLSSFIESHNLVEESHEH